MALYEIAVSLLLVRMSIRPFWFFAAQALGHLISVLISNKFYWWYGRKASTGLGRMLMIAAGGGWGVAGYLVSTSPR
jgi:hypothetical protein